MPSVPASMVNAPFWMATPSLPRRPSPAAVTWMAPPVMVSTSLDAMPLLYRPVTVSVPPPLMVRSFFEKTAALGSSVSASGKV